MSATIPHLGNCERNPKPDSGGSNHRYSLDRLSHACQHIAASVRDRERFYREVLPDTGAIDGLSLVCEECFSILDATASNLQDRWLIWVMP